MRLSLMRPDSRRRSDTHHLSAESATAMKKLALLIGAALLSPASPAAAGDWVVQPQWVKAHEDFLASTVLQGRGSATRDEAIAAQYVAAEFEAYGLRPAPGMTGYLQVGEITIPAAAGQPAVAAAPTNAIGYLPGTDPNAGILLISAHLDHLGMQGDTIMPGANDDASGTTAVSNSPTRSHRANGCGAASCSFATGARNWAAWARAILARTRRCRCPASWSISSSK